MTSSPVPGFTPGASDVSDPPTSQRTLRVALIEDHPLFREALERLVYEDPLLELTVAVGSIEEFDARSRVPPDVVVVDLHLPGRQGPEGVRHLAARGLSVLVVSAVQDGPVVVETIAAGARGYLSKDARRAEILSAIGSVAIGRTYVSPTLAGFLVQSAHRGAAPDVPTLSEREREVLALLARGATDQGIAKELTISISTVRSHLDRIRDKTGCRRRADLTRFALENRLGRP
ncbi:MAG: response regulator [Angustibacter sp.]